MESTTTGEAAVSNGSRERPRKPFMMVLDGKENIKEKVKDRRMKQKRQTR